MLDYSSYVGKPLINVEQEIRDGFDGTIAIIPPFSVITTDIRPDRLKIFIDDQGVINRIVRG